MSELIVEHEGLRVHITAPPGVDVWLAARAAFDAARVAPIVAPGEVGAPPIRRGGAPSPGGASERIRELAAEMLSDGRPRERREIAKAVRDAGLKSEGLDQALKRDKRFQRDHNVMGRPIWRDVSVPPPPAPEPLPDHEKPEWMRTRNGAAAP